MNCSDIDQFVSECNREAGSHVAQCGDCRRLLELLAAPMAIPFEEGAPREAISARIMRELR